MINLLLQKKQFLLYCVIGFSGVALDTGVYSLLVKSGLLGFQAANVVSYSCGTILSFILNARYNFRVTDKIGLRLARFFGVGILGLLVSAGLLHRLVDVYHFDNIISKIATLPVIVLLQYNLNRLFSFHKAR